MNAAIDYAADLANEHLGDLAKMHPNELVRCWAKNVFHARCLENKQPLIASVARNKAREAFYSCNSFVEVLGEASIHGGTVCSFR